MCPENFPISNPTIVIWVPIPSPPGQLNTPLLQMASHFRLYPGHTASYCTIARGKTMPSPPQYTGVQWWLPIVLIPAFVHGSPECPLLPSCFSSLGVFLHTWCTKCSLRSTVAWHTPTWSLSSSQPDQFSLPNLRHSEDFHKVLVHYLLVRFFNYSPLKS